MATSTSRILHIIEKHNGFFSPNTIADALVSSKSKKSKSKQTDRVSRKDTQKTEQLIRYAIAALLDAGFVVKKKGKYKLHHPFIFTGSFIYNGKGTGKVLFNGNVEVHIDREDNNRARNKDIVEVKLTDIRNGMVFGAIKKIISSNKHFFFARCVASSGKYRTLQLVDVPGSIQVITQDAIALHALALVSVSNTFINNLQACTINAVIENEEQHDVKRIILKHSLPPQHPEYPHLKTIEEHIRPSELHNREDLRKLFTITIDGDTAKDFDDAISLEYKRRTYTLHVHIADVSAYVEINDVIDQEAVKRGTSYYLGDVVIPMLPERLSNDLCSLKAGVDRLALSVMIQFDSNGNYRTHHITRSIINVDQRLTYKTADDILHSSKKGAIAAMLAHAKDLTLKLKTKRLSNGRVDLNLADAEMIYDNNASISDIAFATRLQSHMIIEECMLSANEIVSKVLRQNNVPALYRVHEPIAEEKFIALQKFLNTFGIALKNEENIGRALQKIIDSAADKEYQQVLNFIVLKSLMQAYYGPLPLGHFGLGFKDYTHFTSPIRRYPDLVVHRCIKSFIDKTKPPYLTQELQDIGQKTSQLERAAQSAERDLIKLKSARVLHEKIGEEFEGIISGVTRFGFYVSLLDRPIEGMVPLKLLTDDYYLVNEDDHTIIGRRLGKRYRLGDIVTVRLSSVDIDLMRIDFSVV